MTSQDVRSSASPGVIATVRFACPRCREPLAPPDGLAAPRCIQCGYLAVQTDGIVSFMSDATAYDWQEFYETKAGGHGGDTTSGVGYSFPIQQRYMIEGFRRIFGHSRTEASILDVGCGNGLFWSTLFGSTAVVGVDFSLRMCALARARGMVVFHCDARTLPFAAQQFDLIYSAEMVQHITDLPALIAEFSRVCRPGGRIVISTLNQASWYRRGYFLARSLITRRKPGHAPIMRTPEEFAELARKHSLSLGRVCWTHFPLPWIRCSTTTTYPLRPLASNFVIELVKS